MYDRALNFLLFKVVFVGAILEPRWEELLIWTAWFTILGFLRVFSMLCRDRFEYVRTTKRWQNYRQSVVNEGESLGGTK